MTNHGVLDNVIMVSKLWWDARTPTCQTAIREAVAAGGRHTVELTYSVIEDLALPAFEARGVTMVTPTQAQWEQMRDAVLPGIEQSYIEQNGERGRVLLEGLKREIASYED